ncbi:alpha-pyrone synthesis polyketide synthase-like Pks18 [Diplogelasinospora grovesii]|uniref:Alpha-pyrone synthesis polyketide synthase-like Pks18 n=1 Tax=Diplogelasinospora grovesii TaxID=303347 RepID=A0AAN6MYE3_9PEZI|nr:alpha-pyrone synthesis polyketide synthase-like Pks18 [Diplogelasinospora grovesii]
MWSRERRSTTPVSIDENLLKTPAEPPAAVIEAIATGNPESFKSQSEAAGEVAALFGADSPHSARIPRLYAKTRIDRRHMAVNPLTEDFDRSASIRPRMDNFLKHAGPLAVDVASRALSGAGIVSPENEIGLLVMVTSTGFIAPGVDVAVMKGCGLSDSVGRVVINFMGCAAAMNGLRTASDFACAHPESKALVVCVELSSVNGVFKPDINDVVISSLFGDGCAAIVVGSTHSASQQQQQQQQQPTLAPGKIIIRKCFSKLVRGTEEGIILGVNADGITCELSPKLPNYINAGVGPVLDEILAANGLTKADIDLWAIHPGGPKIIEESLKSLQLPDEVAAISWEMLSRYGNMLSVSLPFVLKRMAAEAKEKRPVSTGVAFSFGPGITVEGILFEVVGN